MILCTVCILSLDFFKCPPPLLCHDYWSADGSDGQYDDAEQIKKTRHDTNLIMWWPLYTEHTQIHKMFLQLAIFTNKHMQDILRSEILKLSLAYANRWWQINVYLNEISSEPEESLNHLYQKSVPSGQLVRSQFTNPNHLNGFLDCLATQILADLPTWSYLSWSPAGHSAAVLHIW